MDPPVDEGLPDATEDDSEATDADEDWFAFDVGASADTVVRIAFSLVLLR